MENVFAFHFGTQQDSTRNRAFASRKSTEENSNVGKCLLLTPIRGAVASVIWLHERRNPEHDSRQREHGDIGIDVEGNGPNRITKAKGGCRHFLQTSSIHDATAMSTYAQGYVPNPMRTNTIKEHEMTGNAIGTRP